MKEKYYYIYKLTNLVNNKIYVGKHITTNLDDGYMGSGKLIQLAEKKYGLDNFKKEIVCFCESEEELNQKEAEIVNEEFLKRDDVYNLKLGGDGGWDHTKGMATVKDKNGNCFDVKQDDPRYISGELDGVTKGMAVVKDRNGNIFQVSVDDPRYKSGELQSFNKNTVPVKDKNGRHYMVSIKDPRYLSGELVHATKGLVIVKDKDGRHYMVSINDPRYKSGELVGISKGKCLLDSTKQKIGKANSILQQGEHNSQYGKMWIYNPELKQNKSIFKTEEIPLGWFKGRKMKF